HRVWCGVAGIAPPRGEAAGIGGALLARGNAGGQGASRIAWLRGREFCQSTGVTNIYDETAERAYGLARNIDCEAAQAIFLTGTGMPTLPVLEALEHDHGQPVISSASAMMWHALRSVGVRQPTPAYGRLLTPELPSARAG